MSLLWIIGGGAIGYVLVGKVEYVRTNILILYSALVGSLCFVTGVDYLIIAHSLVRPATRLHLCCVATFPQCRVQAPVPP